MPKYLDGRNGVAISGVKWDIGNFKLWQSPNDDIILFTPKQPHLAKSKDTGRYQASVTQFRAQREGEGYGIIGGASAFTLTTAVQYSQEQFEQIKSQWRAEIIGSGRANTQNPRFVPLNTRKGVATAEIPAISGTAKQEHNNEDLGTPGGTISFLVDLTPEGAQEWVQAIKQGNNVTANVVIGYEYLQLLPQTSVHVRVNGRRVFRHLSGHLKTSAGGVLYGGSAEIQAQWERMTRTGAVEVEVNGLQALPSGTEEMKQNILNTFIEQSLQHLFDSLFEAKPDVEPAEAGDRGGLFGGTNFAMKWQKESEATNLSLDMEFNGWTWLKARMDADVTTFFSQLDDSYVTEVNTEMSFPASVVVDSDPMLENVALSWSASEGKAPETPVFGSEGGNKTYTVTSQHPDEVEVSHRAKVNFAAAEWPVIETSGKGTVAEGANQVVIKPASWVGRHMIYMFVREGDRIKTMDIENDYLIVNVSYDGPHLSNPLKTSTRLTPLEPVEFSYPLDPQGRRGEAKFSAFGVIGGRLVRSEERPIDFDEEAVFILATQDGIQLVSRNSVLPETDRLAQTLRRGQAHPIVDGSPARPEAPAPEATPEGEKANGTFSGTVVAVEYSVEGPALMVETDSGQKKRVRLRSLEQADLFDDERKRVSVRMSGEYAEDIVVRL